MLPDVLVPFRNATHARMRRAARPRSSLRRPTSMSRTPACGARGLDVLSRRDRGQSQMDIAPTVLQRTHRHSLSAAQATGDARQQRRTVVDLAQAPCLAHLLEVVEELRRLVVGTRARPARLWPCRQNFHKFSSTRGLAMDCRKSAARWAWRFERVAVLTFTGGQ